MPRREFAIALAAAAALAAGGYALYRRDLAAARMRAGKSAVASTPCGPIEYATHGTGQPVLVVHGAGGGFDQGIAFGSPLAERGFRVVAMSRFGYLRTPLPAVATAAAQADAHACLLDALALERAAVVGISAGAPSAIELALRHPERVSALVLVVPAAFVPRSDGSPSVRTPPGVLELFDTALRSDFLFWAIRRAAPSLMTRALLGTRPELVASATASERARVAAILDSILPVSERRVGLLNDALVTSRLERPPLETISVPTLAISAADDLYGTYDSAQYSAAHIPGARFVGYADGGHVFVGHAAEVTAEMAEFLRRPQRIQAGSEAASVARGSRTVQYP
jgi:pimeloyl-ACP methyl ester carboxylesterase